MKKAEKQTSFYLYQNAYQAQEWQHHVPPTLRGRQAQTQEDRLTVHARSSSTPRMLTLPLWEQPGERETRSPGWETEAWLEVPYWKPEWIKDLNAWHILKQKNGRVGAGESMRKRDPKEFYQALSKDTAQPDHHGNQSTNPTLAQRACIKLY